ncbi:ketopantoate reductase family protein [Marinobacter sp. M1N3S26]|uniref:ketopantoate reductase family protein n=1 Tax=unclassified Marinobacter TaxID=83889 RepID=UPI00387B4AEF
MPSPRTSSNPSQSGVEDESIAILGAGALGGLWAAYLPPASTGFVPRNASALSSFRLNYHFQDAEGREHAIVRRWLTDLSATTLLLVTTKAGDTLAALTDIVNRLPESCPIVLFQNGLGSQQAVAQRWPHRPVLAASTTEAANRPTPDRVVHAARGHTWVGALTDQAAGLTPGVIRQLSRSGLEVRGESRILERLWGKLAVNAGINPFTAILDCRNGDILDSPLFLDHIDGLCQELANLITAEGLPAHTPRELRDDIERVARNTAANTSSMRGDFQSGRATEIDYINGYVANRSRELGLNAPVNQMLTDRVKALVS